MDHEALDAKPQHRLPDLPVPVMMPDLFGGLTQEDFEAAQEELRRGCGWG